MMRPSASCHYHWGVSYIVLVHVIARGEAGLVFRSRVRMLQGDAIPMNANEHGVGYRSFSSPSALNVIQEVVGEARQPLDRDRGRFPFPKRKVRRNGNVRLALKVRE
jgi:hypothetical protein